MRSYLIFIGIMNALGTLLLLGALHQNFADGLLRRWTYLLPAQTPYQHSAYGRIWLWWAIIGAAVFAGWNLAAAAWPPEFARVIVLGDIFAYGIFELLAIGGTLSPRFGPGIWIAHGLWLGQAGWGIAVYAGGV